MSDYDPTSIIQDGQHCWWCNKHSLKKAVSNGPLWCGANCMSLYKAWEANDDQKVEKEIENMTATNNNNNNSQETDMILIDDNGHITFNREAYKPNFGSTLEFVWYKSDELVVKEVVSDDDILDLIQDVVNGKLSSWLKKEQCTAFRAFSDDNGNKGQSLMLVEITRKRKYGVGKSRPVADIFGTKEHGHNKTLVSLMEMINKAKKAANPKENKMSDNTNTESKGSIINRVWKGLTGFVKRMIDKINFLAKAWLGWNYEQRTAILGSIATMYGGMWFWYLMGGALPIFITFPITGMWTYALWCASFVLSYAIIAYASYAAAYAVVKACAWLVDLAKTAAVSSDAVGEDVAQAMATA